MIFPLCVEGGYESDNRRVREEAAASAGRLVPFARLDPRCEGRGEARREIEAGSRGIKLHPRAEAFRLDHPAVDGIVAAAAEAEVPVLIHAGTGVGSFGATVTRLAGRHRRCPLILAHAGISDLSWLWAELPDHPNIYFDTAWWTPADLLAMFALVPPGRILYASDAPYMSPPLGLAITLRCALQAGLSPDALELVAGRQLEALLAGSVPITGGPAPGPAAGTGTPTGRRVAAALTAAGGAMLGGGDPQRMLEMAAIATAGDVGGAGREIDPRIPQLVETARAGGEWALPALAFALCLAETPMAEARIALV